MSISVKRFFTNLIIVMTIFMVGFIACTEVSEAAKAKKIRFTNVSSPQTLYIGTAKQFKTKITPYKARNKKVIFKSKNSSIASVSSKGVVTPKKVGTTYITAYVKGQKGKRITRKVIVKRMPVSDVKFTSGSERAIYVGGEVTYRATVYPSNASNKGLSYTSSNPEIASVDSTGKVTMLAEGTVTITATSTDGTNKRGSYTLVSRERITPATCNFIAHRGYSSQAPENTVQAFELAGKAGFWGAETDVRMTSDGQFVLSHDESLKRMCGVSKNVSSLTYAQVRSYKIKSGNNISSYAGKCRIASLGEYLDICKQYDMVPVIEVKMAFNDASAISMLALDEVESTTSYIDEDGNTVQLQSASNDALKDLYDYVKTSMGDREYHFIAFDLRTVTRLSQMAAEDGSTNITFEHLASTNATKSNMDYYLQHNIMLDVNHNASISVITAHIGAGIKVNVWTLDDKEKAWSLLKKGVTSITTNIVLWDPVQEDSDSTQE